jgi:hypothetical protein
VAAALGLGLPRAARLLRAAMKAVPLAADYEPVEFCYEDGDLLAVNKPAGVITAPKHRCGRPRWGARWAWWAAPRRAPGAATLTAPFLNVAARRYVGGSIVNRIIGARGAPPCVVHRLDMNTTGVVLFAKTPEVVPALHHLCFVFDAQLEQVGAFFHELFYLDLLSGLGRSSHRFGAFVGGHYEVAEVKGIQVDLGCGLGQCWEVAAIGQLGSGAMTDGAVGHLHDVFLG